MKITRLVFIGYAMLCNLSFCLSQEKVQPELVLEKLPLPGGPLIRKMDSKEAWSIEFRRVDRNGNQETFSAPATYEPENLRLNPNSVVITRTAPSWHVLLSGKNSKHKMEYWSDGYNHFVQQPEDERPSHIEMYFGQNEGGEEEEPTDAAGSFVDEVIFHAMSQERFPGFEWINSTNYQGIASFEGVKCLVFKENDIIAWISKSKKHPVYWEKGNQARIFKKLGTPSQIVFPEHVAKILEGLKRDSLRYQFKGQRGG